MGKQDGWTMDLNENIPNYDTVRPLLVHADNNIKQMKINLEYSLKSLYELEEAVSIMKQIKKKYVTNFEGLGVVIDTREYGSTYFTL